MTALGQLQEENQKIHTKFVVSIVCGRSCDQGGHLQRVHSCIAGAIISLRVLPTKLNPIIRPIMDAIKLETDPTLQVTVV